MTYIFETIQSVANSIFPLDSFQELFFWLPNDIQVSASLCIALLFILAIKRAILS